MNVLREVLAWTWIVLTAVGAAGGIAYMTLETQDAWREWRQHVG